MVHSTAEFLYNVCGYFVSADLIALCVLIDYSVVMRFVFNSPVSWQYELTLVGLCYAIFIGMPMVFYKQEHLRLTFVTGAMQPKTWYIAMTIMDVLMILFLCFGVYHSISIVKTTWSQYYKTIAIRKGVYYLAFTIGAVISIISQLDVILQRKEEEAPKAIEAANGGKKA